MILCLVGRWVYKRRNMINMMTKGRYSNVNTLVDFGDVGVRGCGGELSAQPLNEKLSQTAGRAQIAGAQQAVDDGYGTCGHGADRQHRARKQAIIIRRVQHYDEQCRPYEYDNDSVLDARLIAFSPYNNRSKHTDNCYY